MSIASLSNWINSEQIHLHNGQFHAHNHVHNHVHNRDELRGRGELGRGGPRGHGPGPRHASQLERVSLRARLGDKYGARDDKKLRLGPCEQLGQHELRGVRIRDGAHKWAGNHQK